MNDPIEDAYPLSPIQSGILFQSLVSGHPELYLEQLHLQLHGILDVERFRTAVRTVSSRLSILRTVFDWRGGDPLQIVVRGQTPEVVYRDLSSFSNADRQETLRGYLERDVARGIDLETGPTTRFSIFYHGKKIHSIVLTYHHILLDAASVPLILGSIAHAYDSLEFPEAPDPTRTLTYRDYVAWILSRDSEQAMHFWRHYLVGATAEPTLSMASSRQRSVARQVRSHGFRLPVQITQELVATARVERLTLNSLLLAAWGASLCRATGSTEAVVGCTIAVRPMSEGKLADIAGLCINTVPIRVRLGLRLTLADLARQIQSDLAQMQEFAFVPLAELKRLMAITGPRDPFQSILVYARAQGLPRAPRGHRWEVIGTREMTHYDLTVDAVLGKELSFTACYPDEVFDQDTLGRLLDDVHQFIDSFRLRSSITLVASGRVSSIASEQTALEEITPMLSRPPRPSLSHTSCDVAVERDAVMAWVGALGGVAIGPDDDFFSCGGDSLASIKAIAALIQKGYAVKVADVYAYPTPHRMAKALASRRPHGSVAQSAIAEPWALSDETRRMMEERYPGNIEDILPLAPIQRSVLRIDPLSPRAQLFHEQSLIEYQGHLDLEVLERSWNHALALHPTLRTAFCLSGREHVQAVLASAPLRLDVYDLQGRTYEEQQSASQEYLARDREVPFDLENLPLLRITVFRLSPNRDAIALRFHIIAMDGWCFAFVLKDVVDAYDSFVRHEQPPARPQRRDYKDYLRWVFAQDWAEALSHWTHYLEGASFVRAIPCRRQPTGVEVGEVQEYATHALVGQLEKCRAFARTYGVTLNSLVQTAWALMLLDMATGEDVVFGATVSGRPAELDGGDTIVGLLFNDIPVRVKRPASSISFGMLARSLQFEFASLRRYEYMPPSDIRHSLSVSGDLDLFQTLLVFENYPRQEEEAVRRRHDAPLTEVQAWRREMSDVELTCYVDERDESLHVRCCFLPHVLDERVVQSVAEAFAAKLSTGIEADRVAHLGAPLE